MRKGLFVVGIVLLLIGVGLTGLVVYANQTPTSANVAAGQAWSLAPGATIGPTYVSISWSGAAAGDTIYLTNTAPSCASPTGVVASGTGASGSFSATLNSGTTYALFACTAGGVSDAANFSYTSFAFTYVMLGGIILAILGIVAIALAFRKKKAMPASGMAPGMGGPTAPPPS